MTGAVVGRVWQEVMELVANVDWETASTALKRNVRMEELRSR